MKTEDLETRIAELEEQLTKARVIEQINQELNIARDEVELLQAMAQPAIAADAFRVALSFIDLDEAGNPMWLQDVAAWQRGEIITGGERYYLPEFPIAQLWFANPTEPLLITDYTTDERVDPVSQDLCAHLGLRASASVPLTQAGRWVGFLMCGWAEPHEFSPQEIVAYTMLPALASPVVENRRLVISLESMVKERTQALQTEIAEKEQAQKVLQISELLYRTTIDTIDDVIHVVDSDLHLVLYNDAFAQWLKTSGVEEEVIGRNLFELFPFLPDSVRQEYQQVFTTGERIILEDSTIIEEQERFTETRKIPVFDDDTVVRVITILHDITERKQAETKRGQMQQDIIEAQQRALQELSTPIIPIVDQIVVMPLIGSVDTMRARDITRALLTGISQYRAKVVILDVTGVPIVDSGVANHLNKTIQAARLKGARTIVTGISDAVAETIVDLGINWGEITTLSNLQTGLIAALGSLGIRLERGTN
jgi:PAS domain S-box-containing protein